PTSSAASPIAALSGVDLSFVPSLSVSDVDAGSATNFTVTVSDTIGALDVPATAGVTIVNNGTSVTLTGSVTAINLALSQLTYTGVVTQPSDDTLTMLSNDNGNSGTGGPLTDSDQVFIHLDLPTSPTAIPDK